MAIFKRFPPWRQLLPVYGVAVLLIYSWTDIWFFWKLPALISFLNIPEILSVYGYLLATNFLESLLILCVPLLMSLILPQRWFHDQFISRGAALVIILAGYFMLLAFQFQTIDGYPDLFLKIWSVILAFGLISLIVVFAPRIHLVRKVIESLADRAIIFPYITIPLSLVAILAILIRLLA